MRSNRSFPLFLLAAFALPSTLGCDLTTTVDVTVINQSTPTSTGTGGEGGSTTTNNGGAGGQGGGDACAVADDCPGQDTDCSVRTCIGQQCGVDLTPDGTPIAAQTPGDCVQEVCDGSGNVTSSTDDADVPDDGNPCTEGACQGGVPTSTLVPQGASCGPDLVCDGMGSCVGCVDPSECPGQDGECQARTCVGGVCGLAFSPAGAPLAVQAPGDCQHQECDGNGNIVSVADNTDLPDDGNECTSEVCAAGAPQHPNLPIDTPCSQAGGQVCSGAGSCVQCNASAQCPGLDTECEARICLANACGLSYAAAGTPVGGQTSNDCLQNQCDGNGTIVSAVDPADVPADDGNQCTDQACIGGAPVFSPSPAGAPCTQNGGTSCDGNGACGGAPQIDDTSPADGAAPVASTPIAVTFTAAMDPATLTGQTTAGACSGSIQVSLDDFVSCVAFSSALATMSDGDTVATFTAAPGLLVNRAYKIRVTTAAEDADGLPLGSPFTQPNGFTTVSPNLCDGSLVISQLYGGGGAAGAVYTHDFVELHNRGTTTVSLDGLSLQYASAGSTFWNNLVPLSGLIPPGGYFLVQLSNSGAAGVPLPAPDLVSAFPNISGSLGKMALINSALPIPSNACPPPGLTIDFIGYGAATCKEGAQPVPTLAPPVAAVRLQSGCLDLDENIADFWVMTPAPRNSASAPSVCPCTAQNESNAGLEADYCAVQSPLSLNVQAGTPTPPLFGHLFEAGLTEGMGPDFLVRAQVGYGPATANPQYEASWQWTDAWFNAQVGDNDEYQAMLNAPAAGSYRYGYRFSLDQGVSWTYCDGNAGDLGAGSAMGFTFELEHMPMLIVDP